ncbi:MAG: Esterase EstB [Xylophilus sp.]|nr:MAG: Esterase EstB [Xylophilus sp.]
MPSPARWPNGASSAPSCWSPATAAPCSATPPAALALVGQGRLALDAPITDWLPDFRPPGPDGAPAAITVRQLLTRTAGLGYRFLESDGQGPLARAGVSDGLDASGITLAQNLRRLAGVPLLFALGTAWSYSLATDVLGGVIEAAAGAPLPQAVARLVTGPLGLRDTAFHALDAARLAVPYVNDAPGPHRLAEGETVSPYEELVGVRYSPSRALDPAAFPSGSHGMVGSAGDVLRLLEALRAGGAPLLPTALVDEMGRNQTGAWGRPTRRAPASAWAFRCCATRPPPARPNRPAPGARAAPTATAGSWTVPGRSPWSR